MPLEERARLGEVRVAMVPVRAVGADRVGDRLRVTGGDELDGPARCSFGRVAGAELVDGRTGAGHALEDLVADHARRLCGRTEDAQHHVVRTEDLRDVDVGDLVEKADVADAGGLRLGLGLVGSPAEEIPLDAFVLRHPRRLDDVLRAVQRQVGAMVEDAEGPRRVRGELCRRLHRTEHRLVRARQQRAHPRSRHAELVGAEVHMARRVPGHEVRRVHHPRLERVQLPRPRLLRLPLALFQHLLVPGRDHRIEEHLHPPRMRPAAGGEDVALATDRHPHEIGQRLPAQTAQGRLDVAEAGEPLHEEVVHLPPQLAEERGRHAIARVAGIEPSPEQYLLCHKGLIIPQPTGVVHPRRAGDGARAGCETETGGHWGLPSSERWTDSLPRGPSASRSPSPCASAP